MSYKFEGGFAIKRLVKFTAYFRSHALFLFFFFFFPFCFPIVCMHVN